MTQQGKKKDNSLASAKKMAATFGFDIEKLSEDLATEVAEKAQAKLKLPETPDTESLAYKVLELLKDRLPTLNVDEIVKQTEAKLASKITELFRIINEKLSSDLEERVKQIFDELNIIRQTIPALIEQREQAFREEIATGLREVGAGAPAGPGKGGLSFLNGIPPETMGKLLDKAIDKVLGTPQQADQSKLLEATIRGLLLGQKIKVGEAKIEDLAGIFGVGQTTK